MVRKSSSISAPCPLFACLVCRTKTGWPHQGWCELKKESKPGCVLCRYWKSSLRICCHPAKRKGASGIEKNQRPI